MLLAYLGHVSVCTESSPVRCAQVPPNYSVKWTAANRHGIFMHLVAAATYLKR